MRRWYITYLVKGGRHERAILEAGTAAGAICKCMEMHAELDGGCGASVFLADQERMLGMGLPTGRDPTRGDS